MNHRPCVWPAAVILMASASCFGVTIDDFTEGATIAFPAGETMVDGAGGTYSLANMTFASGANVTLRNMTVNLAGDMTVADGASLTLDKVAYKLPSTSNVLNVGNGTVLAFNNGSTFYGRYISFFNVPNGYATLSCEGGTFAPSLRWTRKSGDAYGTFKAGPDGVLQLMNGASTQTSVEYVNLVADRGRIEFLNSPWAKPQGAYELTIPATGYETARLQSPSTEWNLTAAATLSVDARAVVVDEAPVTIPLISAKSLSIADTSFYENAAVQAPTETIPSFVVDATSLKLVLTPSHLHTWEETGRIVEPTATETGSRFIVCSSCHLEREVVLPAYGVPGEPDAGAVTYTWTGLGYGGNWKHPVNWSPSVTPCRGYPDGPEARVVLPTGRHVITGDGKETAYAISNVTWQTGVEVELSDLTLKAKDTLNQFDIAGAVRCRRAVLDASASKNGRLGLAGAARLELGAGAEAITSSGQYVDLWSTAGANLTYRDDTFSQMIRWSAKTGDVLCVTNAVLNFTHSSNGTQMNYGKATIKVQEGTIQFKTDFAPQAGAKFEFLLPAAGTTSDTVCLGGWDDNSKTTRTINLSALTADAITVDVSQVARSGVYPIIRAESLVLPEGGLAALSGMTFVTHKRQTAELVYDPETDPNVLSVRATSSNGLILICR